MDITKSLVICAHVRGIKEKFLNGIFKWSYLIRTTRHLRKSVILTTTFYDSSQIRTSGSQVYENILMGSKVINGNMKGVLAFSEVVLVSFAQRPCLRTNRDHFFISQTVIKRFLFNK